MIRKKKETRYFATMRLIFKLVSEAKFTEIRRHFYHPPQLKKSGDQVKHRQLSAGGCILFRVSNHQKGGRHA